MVNEIQDFTHMNVSYKNNDHEKMPTRIERNQIHAAEVKETAQDTGKTHDVSAKTDENLTVADTDSDGMVNKEEYNQMPQPVPQAESGMYNKDSETVDSDKKSGKLIDKVV